MPDPSVPAVYWDANVFLNWVEDQPQHADLIGFLLDEVRAGAMVIYTSVLSQVEVAYSATERQQQALSPEVEKTIDELWAPGGPAKTVEVYPLIVARARNLIRAGVSRGWTGLRSIDAIHIATAKQMEVVEMHTLEPKLSRYSEVVGFPIQEPRTLEPRIIA